MIRRSANRAAFSLVELMVVIGIIGVLIGLLMPMLTRARQQANSVRCKANLHDLGVHLKMYENDYKGFLFPVGPLNPFTNLPTTLGTNVPPNERWPMKVYKVSSAPWPLPFDPNTYPGDVDNDPNTFPAGPFTPAVLVCPTDYEPAEAHSYVLNQHLADNFIKASSHNFGGLTAVDVVVAGEKVTQEPDYYMEKGPNNTEFDRVVEKYRHGPKLGSNYLHFDGHVDTLLPREALTGIDPWDLRLSNPATQPSAP